MLSFRIQIILIAWILMTSSPGNLNSIRTVLREQRVCQQSWHFINLIKRHTKYLCAVFVFEYRKNEPIGIFFFVHWRHLLDIFSAHAGLLHTCWWILKRADKNQKRKKNINAYLQIERYKKWLWNVWMQFVWTNHTIHAFTRTIDTHIAHRTSHTAPWYRFLRLHRLFLLAFFPSFFGLSFDRLHDWPYCFQMLAKWSQPRYFFCLFLYSDEFIRYVVVCVFGVRSCWYFSLSPCSVLVSLRLCAHVGEKE